MADDDSGEKSVSVLLSGEESEMTFIDHAYIEMTVSFWQNDDWTSLNPIWFIFNV